MRRWRRMMEPIPLQEMMFYGRRCVVTGIARGGRPAAGYNALAVRFLSPAGVVVGYEAIRASMFHRGASATGRRLAWDRTHYGPTLKECPTCKRPKDAVNHVPGRIFVGWGTGWQTCPTCHGTQRVPA